jgi:hypothetical protein
VPGAYSFLTQIRDVPLRNAIKVILDRLGTVEQSAQSIGRVTAPLDDDMAGGGHRLTGLGDPTDDQDAVTLAYLKKYVDNRLLAAGLVDASGNAVTAQDSDGGQTARGVADAGSDGHPSVSGLTAYNAGLIIGGTAHEFPALVAQVADAATLDANRLELLRRTIWHLIQFGFTAGRQMNPSGILSTDKIAVVEEGQLRSFDCYTGTFETGLTVQAVQVFPPNLSADGGIAD